MTMFDDGKGLLSQNLTAALFANHHLQITSLLGLRYVRGAVSMDVFRILPILKTKYDFKIEATPIGA